MSKILETLIEHEIERRGLRGISTEHIPVVANKIESELQNLGIYIGNVYRADRYASIYVETKEMQDFELRNPNHPCGKIFDLTDFALAAAKLYPNAFPMVNKVVPTLQNIMEEAKQKGNLAFLDVPPVVSRSRDDFYWVCVYRDETGPHGNYDNLVEIQVSEQDLRDFVKQTDWPSFDQFLEECTADDTDGLVAFLKERDHYVEPDEVLYTRAIIDLYEKYGKYDPDNLDMTKDELHYDALHSSDDSMLYSLREHVLPNVPKSKQTELAEQIKTLEEGRIPSVSVKVLKSGYLCLI